MSSIVASISEELVRLSAGAVCFPACEERQGEADLNGFRLRARTRSGWLRTAANVLLSEVRFDAGPGILLALAEGNYKDEGSAIAAAVVVAELGRRFGPAIPWAAAAETLRGSFQAAHSRIVAIGQTTTPLDETFDTVMGRRRDLQGIGAAVTAIVVGPRGEGVVAHVGDCRAYLLQDGRTTQVTTDHTLATAIANGEVEVQGEVPAADHIVMRVLGSDTLPEIDLVRVTVGKGDLLVLASCLARPVLPWSAMPPGLADDPGKLMAALFDRIEQESAPAAIVVARRDAVR